VLKNGEGFLSRQINLWLGAEKLRLKDKVALITGAGRGIGQAAGVRFANEGAKVVVVDIDSKEGMETVEMIESAGGEAFFVHADVSKAADAEKMVKVAVEKFGRLDILFNNAGIELVGRVDEMPENDWDRLIAINLKGVFLGSKYAVPQMLKQGGGVIINTASAAGLFGLGGEPAYCASKGGVIALTRAMAMDYADKNIRVNCICPGPTATRLTKPLQSTIKKVALGRIAKPEEIANVALFLASDESSFVTGHPLIVDGGSIAGQTRAQWLMQ
jgi:meso-butanediol dehydrogenase/(S,S)-butanediol dehydrogenase/diacetyl reductase